MDPPPRKYSQQRYWRYVFTPMILLIVAFGIYILFTMPDTQSLTAQQIAKRIGSLRANVGNNFSTVGTPGNSPS